MAGIALYLSSEMDIAVLVADGCILIYKLEVEHWTFHVPYLAMGTYVRMCLRRGWGKWMNLVGDEK